MDSRDSKTERRIATLAVLTLLLAGCNNVTVLTVVGADATIQSRADWAESLRALWDEAAARFEKQSGIRFQMAEAVPWVPRDTGGVRRRLWSGLPAQTVRRDVVAVIVAGGNPQSRVTPFDDQFIAVINPDGEHAANVAALEGAFRRIYGVEGENPGERNTGRLKRMRGFPLGGGLDGWPAAKDAYLKQVWREAGESEDDLRSYLISIFESQGITGRVAAYREEAAAAKPGDSKRLMDWAIALQKDARPGEGIPLMTRLLRAAPDYPGGQTQLGILQALDGKKDQAEQSFQKALELNPDDATARMNLGALVIEQLGRREEGLAHFREAVRRHPENDAARKNLAMALAAQRGLAKKAEELKAAAMEAGNGEGYLRLGIAYARLGRMTEAAGALSEAVRRAPDSRQARQNYATVAMVQRDYASARRAVEEMRALGMEVDPSFADAVRIAATLQTK